jgi:hypothetical protein
MDGNRDQRVAWIINHTTLGAFEVPLLRSFGLEVWTSKLLPHKRDFFSATVDYSDDAHSTLPADVLQTLNDHNFYEDEFTPEVADCLNAHFGTVFCASIGLTINELVNHFRGRILVRVFGLLEPYRYSDTFKICGGEAMWNRIRQIKRRFWLAPSYEPIPGREDPLLRERAVVLPLGIPEATMNNRGTWVGTDKRLLFVYPRIPALPHPYAKGYHDFKAYFRGVPHLIAGRQHRPIDDPHVVGYAPDEVFQKWMRECAVMFYHSREPRHLHYHPLEAIVYGMPLIYMRGGLLEYYGGDEQPGCADSLREARRKVERVLNGDRSFIAAVRRAQEQVLTPFTWDYNRKKWRELFIGRVMRTPAGEPRATPAAVTGAGVLRRLGIVLIEPYRGSTLRWSKDLTKALHVAARQRHDALQVVFAYAEGAYDAGYDLGDLKQLGIAVRPFRWKIVRRGDMGELAGLPPPGLRYVPPCETFLLPSDGGNDLRDCDFWLFIGSKVSAPVLPTRPYGLAVFDLVQRYVPEAWRPHDASLLAGGMLPFAREAKFVLVNSPVLAREVTAYVGLPGRRIRQIAPFFECPTKRGGPRLWARDYIVWVTSEAVHKNHLRVTLALRKYYEDLDGKLRVVMVGRNTTFFSSRCKDPAANELPHVAQVKALIADSKALRKHLFVAGELSEASYRSALQHARFLLHANVYDSGALAAVDAAHLGVPTLSARNPGTEFFDQLFGLNLTFFDPYSVDDLAAALKDMETQREVGLPDPATLERFHWRNAAASVYEAVVPHVRLGGAHAYR